MTRFENFSPYVSLIVIVLLGLTALGLQWFTRAENPLRAPAIQLTAPIHQFSLWTKTLFQRFGMVFTSDEEKLELERSVEALSQELVLVDEVIAENQRLRKLLSFREKLIAPLLFYEDDIKDPTHLAVKLRDAGDALSGYLRERSSPETQQLLDEYDGASPPSLALQKALVNELNRAIKGPSLYDKKRFARVSLTEEIRKWTEQKLWGKDLMLFNRFLLEAAYPAEIEKTRLSFATIPPQMQSIPAQVIAIDPVNWLTTVVINKGSADGVQEQHAVIALVNRQVELPPPSLAASSQIPDEINTTLFGPTHQLKGRNPSKLPPVAEKKVPLLAQKKAGEQLAKDADATAVDSPLEPVPAVIRPYSVVGKVIRTTAHTAIVRLIIDMKSTVAVTIQESRQICKMTGKGDGQHTMIEDIPATTEVKVGSPVLIDQRSSYIPRGTVIGIISRIDNNPENPNYHRIIVRPLVDFTRLEEVLVCIPSN